MSFYFRKFTPPDFTSDMFQDAPDAKLVAAPSNVQNFIVNVARGPGVKD